MRQLESRGQTVEGDILEVRKLIRKYMKKEGLGRLYSSGPSLQKITRASRKEALQRIPGGVFELDIRLAFLSLLLHAIREALHQKEDVVCKMFPLLVHVTSHKDEWLSFIAEYFKCDRDIAKKLLQCILSSRGRQSPNSHDRPDWLPHLDALQQEIQSAIVLLADADPLYKEVSHKRPDCNTLHVYLGELDSRVSIDMWR